MANASRTYTQPRRINAVSVTLLLLVAAAGYVAFSAWPVVSLYSDVKTTLDDALPRLYRANLLPESEAAIGTEEVAVVPAFVAATYSAPILAYHASSGLISATSRRRSR